VARDDRVGRQIVGEVGERALVEDRVLAEVLRDAHPRGRRTDPLRRIDEAALEERTPAVIAQGLGRRDLGHPFGLDRRRLALGDLEGRVQVQDRADRLTRDDAPGDEAPSVAQPIHLEPDRLGGVAAADEVRVERVHDVRVGDRRGRGAERLRDDLPAVEPAPRIARAARDEGVGPVRLQPHDVREAHARPIADGARPFPAQFVRPGAPSPDRSAGRRRRALRPRRPP
jgi:hypothetical protein